jgi:membrane protein involved in colicin uptake
MARIPFKLRSQGQPFKMIGATQPVQPVQPPQQDPVQPLYSNPNDPAMQQQQRAPLQQVNEQYQSSVEDKDLTEEQYNAKHGENLKKSDADAKAKADAEAAPDTKKKGGSNILKGAADIITGGLDRVYGSGKTNLLANEKAAEYAAQKSADAKKALAEKRAHELEVIKLGTNKDKNKNETAEEKAERERKEKLARTTNAIDGTSPAAYKSPAKQVDPSMIMSLVGSMGGGKKEEEKKEQPNWKANVKVSE